MKTLNPILGPKPATTVVVGVYARYSCDQQRETSLEDQERRCRELIATLNLSNPTIIIYSDAALSGSAKHYEKRSGYLRTRICLRRNRKHALRGVRALSDRVGD
jgi:hypothetical protein